MAKDPLFTCQVEIVTRAKSMGEACANVAEALRPHAVDWRYVTEPAKVAALPKWAEERIKP